MTEQTKPPRRCDLVTMSNGGLMLVGTPAGSWLAHQAEETEPGCSTRLEFAPLDGSGFRWEAPADVKTDVRRAFDEMMGAAPEWQRETLLKERARMFGEDAQGDAGE